MAATSARNGRRLQRFSDKQAERTGRTGVHGPRAARLGLSMLSRPRSPSYQRLQRRAARAAGHRGRSSHRFFPKRRPPAAPCRVLDPADGLMRRSCGRLNPWVPTTLPAAAYTGSSAARAPQNGPGGQPGRRIPACLILHDTYIILRAVQNQNQNQIYEYYKMRLMCLVLLGDGGHKALCPPSGTI